MDGKADFGSIYEQDDPRAMHATLGALDYQVPRHGAAVFNTVVETLPDGADDVTVVDVCCSYGVNAALLHHEVDFEEVVAHYTDPEAADLDRSEMVDRDRAFFGPKRRERGLNVIGVDASQPAVDYAVDAGLLDDGLVVDLEADDLTSSEAEALAGADLITITGGVGYVGGETFGKLVDACDEPPVVAALTLRWVDYGPIADVLGGHGLATEHVPDWQVPQRRFADESERRHALESLDRLDRACSGWEEAGWHAADLSISRPAAAIDERPASDVVAAVPGGPPDPRDV